MEKQQENKEGKKQNNNS
uniref:Uncharacterized protein n=1 Tax=Rhizophora mucronata TaxID=61149 RepID=A0A2P2Q6J2_RHIMU